MFKERSKSFPFVTLQPWRFEAVAKCPLSSSGSSSSNSASRKRTPGGDGTSQWEKKRGKTLGGISPRRVV